MKKKDIEKLFFCCGYWYKNNFIMKREYQNKQAVHSIKVDTDSYQRDIS